MYNVVEDTTCAESLQTYWVVRKKACLQSVVGRHGTVEILIERMEISF